MSNFNFIKEKFPEIYEVGVEAEKYLRTDRRACAFYCRLTLEVTIKWLFVRDPNLPQPYKPKGLGEFVYVPEFKRLVERDVYDGIHFAMKVGNNAAHTNARLHEYEVATALEAVFSFVKWVAHYYSSCPKNVTFDLSKIPSPKAEASKLRKEEAIAIGEKMRDRFKAQLEAARERDAEEMARLKAELEALKSQNAAETFECDFDPTEAETRKLYIDFLLKEVGWGLSGVNDKEYKLKGMPSAKGTQSSSGIGYADYVLWGDNGKPLAVVEAKRTMVDARDGKQQAELYADCLETMHGQRPVIFYSNGFETYLWDDKEYPARRVYGFYNKKELETLIERRHQRASVYSMEVDKDIAGRPYQERAIKKVLEHFDAKHRRALLVMATGSGKTRTAVALVKCLTQANWAKRILFLADRTSLVSQAMRKGFKPHLPNLSMVNLLEEKENDNNRMVFSTYQTMMNMIDNEREDGTREYGVGHFDLIIIDESHRSIYSKYGAIFDYFDANLIGLTATPKSELDKNTFEIFGMSDGQPTDVYSLKEAVNDGFLVDYKLKQLDLKFPSRGIKYADLSPEEQLEYEETFTDELTGEMPEEISGAAVNSWLFNKDTVRHVLETLMEEGHKVEGGDKLGKTVMFCRSHKHAQFVVDQFHEIWPKYKSHFCQIIDNKCKNPQALIEKFEDKDKMPQIAVSVDMMDTGIDVPEVVNLVFFKPVKSKSKFWQMIGRGTRLCPDLFGPGMDKENFRIFDFCRNFDFFGENSEGFTTGNGETLMQKMFTCRARLSYYLQSGEWQQIEETKALWMECVEWLHEQISGIDADSALVRKNRRSIETFAQKAELKSLNDKKLSALINDISHLPMPGQDEEEMKKRFDVQMLNLMLSIIDKSKAQVRLIKNVMETADELRTKASIPSVHKKLPLLNKLVTNEFWQDINPATVNYLRKEIRDLIKFLEKDDSSQKIFYTNLDDEIIDDGAVWEDAANYGDEFLDYKEKLRRYFDEHTELQSVWKLKNNVALESYDLQELETVIYSSEVSDEEQFKENCDEGCSLTAFVRSLVGMDKKALADAFSEFLDENSFNSKQIDCINIIIENFANNGFMAKEKLREQPFKDFAGGIVGGFGKDNAFKLVKLIDEINDQVG